jgi:hypothetical protein
MKSRFAMFLCSRPPTGSPTERTGFGEGTIGRVGMSPTERGVLLRGRPATQH